MYRIMMQASEYLVAQRVIDKNDAAIFHRRSKKTGIMFFEDLIMNEKSKRKLKACLFLVNVFVVLVIYALGFIFEDQQPILAKIMSGYGCLLVVVFVGYYLMKTKSRPLIKALTTIWAGIGLVFMILLIIGYTNLFVWMIVYLLLSIIWYILSKIHNI